MLTAFGESSELLRLQSLAEKPVSAATWSIRLIKEVCPFLPNHHWVDPHPSHSRPHLSRPQAQSSVPTQILPRAQMQTWLQTDSALHGPCGETRVFPLESSAYVHGPPSPRHPISSPHFTEEEIEVQRKFLYAGHKEEGGRRDISFLSQISPSKQAPSSSSSFLTPFPEVPGLTVALLRSRLRIPDLA